MSKKALPLIFFLLLVVIALAALKWRGGNPPRLVLTPTPTVTETASPSANPTLEEETTPGPSVTGPPTNPPENRTTVGNFTVTDNPVCFEKGKPVIYYFGSATCPHCRWEHPIIKRVAEKFSGLISFHDNMDTQNDLEVFTKYNNIHSGYIPFLVFGCKYARLGSGEDVGEATEEKNLTVLICKLTDSKPDTVCSPLINLIDQVKQPRLIVFK